MNKEMKNMGGDGYMSDDFHLWPGPYAILNPRPSSGPPSI